MSQDLRSEADPTGRGNGVPAPASVDATTPHVERDASRLRAPADVRELTALRKLGRPSPARMIGHLAVIGVVYAAVTAVALVVDRWWAWIPAWAVMSFLLLSWGAVLHEGTHANLTGRTGVDQVLAFLGGWLAFLPAAAYRPYHLVHHATTMSEDDPSGANAKPFKHRREYLLVMALAGPGFTLQMWGIALKTLVGRPPAYISARQVPRMRLETSIGLALYAVVAVAAPLLGVGWLVLAVWVIPAILALCVVSPYILIPEHYDARMDAPILESTATVRSNRVLSFVYLNNNHHTAHHLVSSCNPLELGQITDLIEDRVELRYDSYTDFHRAVFRDLRW